jgi:glycosyltransferase involved in cell wall biosynthesis
MPINIHLIRTHYPHWGAYSGINQFLDYIDQDDYHVDVQLVSDNDEDFPAQNRAVREWLRNAVQKHGMQWYKLSDLVAEVKAFQQCTRKKVNILHYLDGEHSAQFLPRLPRQLRRTRLKIVATYHQPPEMLDSLTIRAVISRLDYVTVVSPEQASYFGGLVAPDRISLILHGVNTDYFRPGNHPNEDKFKCITVGHYLRDFEAVRQVAEKLSSHRDIEFHIVSSRANGLEDLPNVRVYSGISDIQLLQLYQQSHVLFLPLLKSTANNSLLEGIACGLPVISTALPSVKAYLPGHEAILIDDNDPGQLAEAIVHLAHNPTDRGNMGRAARRRAEELDWHNIAPQYTAIYSRLASNH